MKFATVMSASLLGVVIAMATLSVSRAERDDAGNGKKVYERANCVGCHKWSGVGGGGYGGAALSLRQTQLSHSDIVEIVTCGRPGTGMPHFTADPYKGGACYGLQPDDVKDMMPPDANVVLHTDEINEVASYVVTNIKGRGEPTLAECTSFFGDTSRVCDIYRPKLDAGGASSRHQLPTPTTTGR